MTENDKIAKMADGLWAAYVGFRLIYRYRYRLSKCSCFGSRMITIVIVYRLFLRLSYRNFQIFGIQHYIDVMLICTWNKAKTRRRVACSFPSGKLYCNVTTVLANNKQEARQQHVIPSPLPRRQKKKGENYKKKRERNKREKKEKRTLRKQEK